MISTGYPLLIYQPLFTGCSSYETAESKTSYSTITERHIQAMWLEQKYFKSLTTLDNESIEILSPGIWNSEAGPDFLKAHLKIGDKELRGDIEIHLSQEGWYQHNHHVDSNYNNVILHIYYWTPRKIRPATTSNEKILPSVCLQPFLTISESRIIKLIDLDLYPHKYFTGTGTCSRMLFSHLSKDKASGLLRSAAMWRLKEKNERLKAKVSPLFDLLMGGIAMVLGYKHNADAFLVIFNALNLQRNDSEQEIFIKALAFSNFFNPHFQKKWADSPYYGELLNAYHSLENKPSPLISLKLDKIRPVNHPVRRLALLAKLFHSPESKTIGPSLLALWKNHWQGSQKEGWKKLRERFLDVIPSFKENYWEHHYTFEETSSTKPISFLGDELKKEILINACLPMLYADINHRGCEEEQQAFSQFYSCLPASKTKKSKYLHYRFFGNKPDSALCTADLQQGAYQIHRDFCVHFEASCQGCPFVDRYKNAFEKISDNRR